MNKGLFYLIFIFFYLNSSAQFAPAANQSGSTAIHKDSSVIVAWATTCSLDIGLADISQPTLGLSNSGTYENATGKAGEGGFISLGDGGMATLTFEYPLTNGTGPDFAVFENAFNASFLELAFVEASSDGQNFVRFPAISNTDTSLQIGSFDILDATNIHNLAGKYQANYGTQFDLNDLIADSVIINLNKVTHLRIIDVVGSIQNTYASRDSRGIKINDPWSTPFPSGGFDLDAVGVININMDVPIKQIQDPFFAIFPNPVKSGNNIIIDAKEWESYTIMIHNIQGAMVILQKESPTNIETISLHPGCYFITITNGIKRSIRKLLIH